MNKRIKNTIQHETRGRLVCRIVGYGVVYPYLVASNNPFRARGVGLYEESKQFLKGKHLGKRVSFDSVPPDVQCFILQSI